MTIPRLQCQSCEKYFLITHTEDSCDLDGLSGVNITKALRRIATLCGASWPYEQAEKVIRELTGVCVSHDHIQILCASEAKVISEQHQQTYDTLENDALVESMEAMVGYLADADTEENSTGQRTEEENEAMVDLPDVDEDRLYMGIDGVYIGEVRKKKYIEAKVGIVFTDERATISKGRNLLLNKQYTGTFESSDKFSEKLFCSAKEMGLGEKTELIILGDGARWITKLAKTQYPQATLILDWWHLKRRVWETVDYLKRHHMSEEQALEWGREVVDFLWCGDAKKALLSILNLCQYLSIDVPKQMSQKRLDERTPVALYCYVRNNQSQIVDYQSRKQLGYFISSVFAEKAIDVLVCRRQKCRGMNWSLSGAENVLILRQLLLNEQWENHWQTQMAA